jgi:hypothetical protein
VGLHKWSIVEGDDHGDPTGIAVSWGSGGSSNPITLDIVMEEGFIADFWTIFQDAIGDLFAVDGVHSVTMELRSRIHRATDTRPT